MHLGCSECANHQCPTFADSPADWGGGDFPTELYKLQPTGMFGTPADPKWVFHSIVAVDQPYGPSEPVTPAVGGVFCSRWLCSFGVMAATPFNSFHSHRITLILT